MIGPMRRLRTLGVGATMLSVAVVVAPSPAFAAVPPCGSNITVNTTLTGNMTCPGNGLNIVAPNITLDLNGFTITGPGPDVRPSPTEIYSGVNVGRSGVVVKNGRVEAFTFAVTTRSQANNVEITGLILHNNGQGFLTQSGAPGGLGPFSDDSWFHDNTVDSSTSNAMTIQGNRHRIESNRIFGNRFGVSILGSATLFRANVVEGNRSTGVNVGSNVLGDNNVLSGNTIVGNTGNGVNIGSPNITRVMEGNRLEGNRIVSNGDPANTFGAVNVFSSNGAVVAGNQVVGIARAIGIALNTGSANTQVSGNELTSNTDGVFVSSGATAALVSGNNAMRNTHDGIRVSSASTTITANGAFSNATFGIEAVSGVTDGGGNRAAGNGVAQCSPSLVCT